MAKFCPECGASAEGAKFCPECGTALNGQMTSASVAPAPSVAPTEDEERDLWNGKPDSALAPLGERSQRYTLTTERLKVDSGMLRQKAESLDLWRVKDVAVKKSITQRTRGCGDVEITSADATTPKVTLTWIKNPEEVAEQVRQAAREARTRHGVVTQERY
jgi:hypothetical protein